MKATKKVDQAAQAAEQVQAAEQTTIPASEVLAAARGAVASAIGSVYGAKRTYARELNALFGTAPNYDGKYWWEVKGDMKGSEFATVQKEQKEFYAVMDKAGHSNKHKVWADIRGYAYEESGLKVEVQAEGAEGEGAEGEGAGASARPIKGRMIEELSKLYKARFNDKYASEITDEIRAATLHIEQALIVLGVNLNDLVK